MKGKFKIRMADGKIGPKTYQYFRIIKAILLVFMLVICTNWLNQRYQLIAKDMTDSVCESHIISHYYLYRLNRLFGLKRLQLSADLSFPDGFKESKTIEKELANFENTQLTSRESLHLNNLKKKYSELSTLEKSIPLGSNETLEQARLKMNANLDHIMVSLDSMANVKFTERKQFLKTKNKLLYTNKLLLNIELAFLIVVGTIIQLVIYYPWKS